ncbi:hypothetical protein U1Q18_050604 [Sarracenia purpurea var. burkii]
MRPVRTAKTIAKQNIRSTYQSPRSSEYSKPAPAATAMSNDEKLKNASLVQQTESKPEVTFQVPGSAKPGTSSSENKPEMSPSTSPEKSDGEYTENESNHGSPYVKSTVQKSPGYRRDPAIENDFVDLINISSETLPNLEADASAQLNNFGKKEFEPQRSITAPKVEPRPKEQKVRRTKEWWSDTEEEKALPSHPMHDSKKIYAKTKAAFRNHDARIEQTVEDVGKLTLTVDKHADLFNDMAARREELSKRVHDNSESIRGLTEHSVRFSENMSRVTAAHGTAITGLQQRFVKGMTHMKQRLDKHEEVLYQHDKAVLLLYTDVKGTAKALDEMLQEISTSPAAKPDAVNRGASPVPVQEIIIQPPEIPSKKKKKKKKKRSAAVKIEAANCNGESSDEGVDVETPVELKEPELKLHRTIDIDTNRRYRCTSEEEEGQTEEAPPSTRFSSVYENFSHVRNILEETVTFDSISIHRIQL